MKFLVFIDHDIMIRHFIHSGAFSELMKRHDVRFVFPEDGRNRIKSDVETLGLGPRVIRIPTFTKRVGTWKEIFNVNQLRWRFGKGFAAQRLAYASILGPKKTRFYRLRGLPLVRSIFMRRRMAILDRLPNPIAELIEREKPDALVHPTVLDGLYVHDLIYFSHRAHVPLVLIMNSWDNPGTKQTLIHKPDCLLVWGEQTRQHAITYIGMRPENVVVMGAAQFEVYNQPARVNREEFCRLHDVSPDQLLLLYAGSSKGAAEIQHLKMLDEAIEAGELGAVKVIYRPHPWGNAGAGGEAILDTPFRHVRIESTMREYLERIRSGNLSMYLPDYGHTRDVLHSVDATISPLSTIILESVLCGKLSMCLLPIGESKNDLFRWNSQLIHFHELMADPAIVVARGVDSLVPATKKLIEKARAPDMADVMRKAASFYLTPFAEPYPLRLERFLISFVQAAAK